MGHSVLTDLNIVSATFFDPKIEPHRVIFNFIFNRPDHLFLQSETGWKTFDLKINDKSMAQLTFFMTKKNAVSPWRAPFGSLQTSGRITLNQLDFFLLYIEEFLTRSGIKKVTITNYPEAYHITNTRLLYKTLSARQFRIREHTSCVIAVDKNEFEIKIKTSEKQKLRKSRSSFQFRRAPLAELATVYKFISTCRLQRNQSLSMTLPQLRRTVSKFPKDFFLFEAANENETAAAAIVIRINKKILYTFYYAHDKKFDKTSPIVFLISEIYSFARQNHYSMIDLGTSMKGDEINKPLLHFKESIGGIPTAKFIFEKDLV